MRVMSSNSLTASDLRPGQWGVVAAIRGHGAVRQRLLDVGILPRAHIKIERIALAGDPIWINTGGLHLSLRRNEAQLVVLEAELGGAPDHDE